MALLATCVFFVSCLVAASANPFSYRSPNCKRCTTVEECFSPPASGCIYGEYKDSCGYINCFRGPGESCSNSTGTKKCANNLSCLCGKCLGCYMDSEETKCFNNNSAACLYTRQFTSHN